VPKQARTKDIGRDGTLRESVHTKGFVVLCLGVRSFGSLRWFRVRSVLETATRLWSEAIAYLGLRLVTGLVAHA